MKEKVMSFVGMVTALLASACCIGPALFLMFGITGLGFLSRLEWMRPYFLVGTFILGCISYHYAYGKGSDCNPGGGCNTHSRRINRVLFWILVGFIFFGVSFPYITAWLFS